MGLTNAYSYDRQTNYYELSGRKKRETKVRVKIEYRHLYSFDTDLILIDLALTFSHLSTNKTPSDLQTPNSTPGLHPTGHPHSHGTGVRKKK